MRVFSVLLWSDPDFGQPHSKTSKKSLVFAPLSKNKDLTTIPIR